MHGMKNIGILIERQRAYGRRLCNGVIRFARERGDWNLGIVEFASLSRRSLLAKYDGFIARVMNDGMAERLKASGRPVVDVFFERPIDGFAAADQDASKVGQLAASHFMEHRFTRFAFCGYNGRSYSDTRRDAFVRCLALHHFGCETYRTPKSALRSFDDSVVLSERFGAAPDAKNLERWIRGLKKPVAVFCAHDMRAYQLIEVCRRLGVSVPDEVAVLGVDDDELVCNFVSPTISSIDQNAAGIGYAAARALQEMFDSPGHVPAVAKVPPLRLMPRQSTETYPIEPKWLSDALVYISANISRGINAADVHAHVGKSHTLVESAFRERLGTSVKKEVMRVRLDEARRLLETTDLPIGRIASMSGFGSQQYLSASFRRNLGATPLSFRTGARQPAAS